MKCSKTAKKRMNMQCFSDVDEECKHHSMTLYDFVMKETRS